MSNDSHDSASNSPSGPGKPGGDGAPGNTWPAFDPAAVHQQRPRIRAVRGFAMKQGEQLYLGLADARQVSDKVVFTSPAAQFILPHMSGENTLDEIVRKVNETLEQPQFQAQIPPAGAPGAAPANRLTRDILEKFIAQLDDAALLEGPGYDALLRKAREDFDSAPNLPPSVTANFADAMVAAEAGEAVTDEQKAARGPAKLRAAFDTWISEALKDAPDPSFDGLPRAVVAPHIDYPRGWLNYAAVYGRMRVVDRPDRVVILGTNHFGFATGVCACDKGFQTPLGVSPLAEDVLAALKERLGVENATRMLAHRFDHEREHSIELQVAWLQHVFAPSDGGSHVPVFGALVHDPSVKAGKSYDGAGLDMAPFVEALKQALASLPGRTLVVASADLSHVGPQFGDQFAIAGDEETNPQGVQARNKTIEHDRKMIDFVAKRKPDELVAAMAWQKNPTRWCSVGNLVAALKAVEPSEVRLLNYAAAVDQNGSGMVSTFSAAMF